MQLFEGLVDDKILKIINLFLNKPDEFFHINQTSELTGVSLASTFRIINKLVEKNILDYKEISKFKVYKLAKNKKTKKLGEVL